MTSKAKTGAKDKPAPNPADDTSQKTARAIRETVESIAIAVILAFLFRGFEAEAFVIPTGSMAPTLMGRHCDVTCRECGFEYQAGASIENSEEDAGPRADMTRGRSEVVATTCPLCRYTMTLDRRDDPDERSFTGDRILVSKLSYDLGDPQRWDVIVFKYPGDAKQNYIKRLVGLPGEQLRIRHGNVYAEQPDGSYGILRKPPDKVEAMLQLVADSKYASPKLVEVGWPDRWQPEGAAAGGEPFKPIDPEGVYKLDGKNGAAGLRYRHFIPHPKDWEAIREGDEVDMTNRFGELISDFYAYNAYTPRYEGYSQTANYSPKEAFYGPPLGFGGANWVGDLAIEATVTIGDQNAATDGEPAELVLDLVKSGVHYTCRIDVTSGVATLSIPGGEFTEVDAEGNTVRTAAEVSGTTSVRAGGEYELRFSNIDDQLLLWVDGDVIEFDGPTTYLPGKIDRPVWSEEDPGDLAPAGIEAVNIAVTAERLRILRDVYYVAVSDKGDTSSEYRPSFYPDAIQEIFGSPSEWSTSELFDARQQVDFQLGPNQFFPMGDNSPQSKDARLWREGGGPESFVERDLLTGKALYVYWPHAWNRPIPWITPNVKRMGVIR
jgi:signal peptidase I